MIGSLVETFPGYWQRGLVDLKDRISSHCHIYCMSLLENDPTENPIPACKIWKWLTPHIKDFFWSPSSCLSIVASSDRWDSWSGSATQFFLFFWVKLASCVKNIGLLNIFSGRETRLGEVFLRYAAEALVSVGGHPKCHSPRTPVWFHDCLLMPEGAEYFQSPILSLYIPKNKPQK